MIDEIKKAGNKSALQSGAEASSTNCTFYFFVCSFTYLFWFLLLFEELMASDFFITPFKGPDYVFLLAVFPLG